MLKIFPKNSYGETAFFYNPKRKLPNGVYFLTIKENDGPNDAASVLSRPGVYRVSFQPNSRTYEKLFGARAARPTKGNVTELDFDFSALDVLMPHPVYAWMGWTMILSPSMSTWSKCFHLVEESYDSARSKFSKVLRSRAIPEE